MRIKILAVMAMVAVFGMVYPVEAQSFSDSGTVPGVPSNIAILTTNSTPGTALQFPVGKTVSVFVTGSNGSTTNTEARTLNFLFGVSGDNVNFTTNYFSGNVASLVPSSTNLFTTRIAVTLTGSRYLRYQGLEWSGGGQATNYWTNLAAFYQIQ